MNLDKPDRERGWKREAILRVLLNHPSGDLSKYRVAKEAKTSQPWAVMVLNDLEDAGFVDGTEVLDPEGLYAHWRETRIPPNRLSVFFQDPMDQVRDAGLDYALTTYRAENLVQRFLFASRTEVYVRAADADAWRDVVAAHGMVGGGNTRLRVTDDHVFYGSQSVQGYTIVSIPQLIVDLLDESGPCAEAAEMLIARHHGGTPP